MPILSDHSLAPEAHAKIHHALVRLEKEYGFQILFACETGERAWGCASTHSAYDIQFIYAYPPYRYLTLDTGRDEIDHLINEKIHIHGLDVRKALRLIHRSSPCIFEWLDSPIIYQQHTNFLLRLRMLASQYYSPFLGHYHYLSLAKRHLKPHFQALDLSVEEYFLILRALASLKWIERFGTYPPIRFSALIETLIEDPAFIDDINTLLQSKKEAQNPPHDFKNSAIHHFIENILQHETFHLEYARPTDSKSESLDELLIQTLLNIPDKMLNRLLQEKLIRLPQ